MVKSHRIILDDSGITFIFNDAKNKKRKAKLRPNDIQSVSIKPCRERKGLKVCESERILVRSALLPKPLEYYKYKESPFFDDYKTGLRLFCRKYKITTFDEAED